MRGDQASVRSTFEFGGGELCASEPRRVAANLRFQRAGQERGLIGLARAPSAPLSEWMVCMELRGKWSGMSVEPRRRTTSSSQPRRVAYTPPAEGGGVGGGGGGWRGGWRRVAVRVAVRSLGAVGNVRSSGAVGNWGGGGGQKRVWMCLGPGLGSASG